MTQTVIPTKKSNTIRYLVVALVVVGAFFASYRFAQALNSNSGAPKTNTVSAAQGGLGSGVAGTGQGGTAGAGSPACACCGTGGSSTPVEGAATVEGSVQRIDVDTSSGGYNPNVIKLKAGVPAELTFGQAGGCLAQVMSSDLDFFEDLTSGAKTVKLPALEAGTYEFSCGMQMVFGSIVVE